MKRIAVLLVLLLVSLPVHASDPEYTPSVINTVNVTTLNMFEHYYQRVGNTFTVWGAMEIQPTTTSVMTKIEFSLPYTAHFTNHWQCSGGGFNPGITRALAIGSSILTDFGHDDTVGLAFLAPDALLRIYYIHFSCVIPE